MTSLVARAETRRWITALLVALGLAGRWVGLTHESLWLDEGFSVHIATSDAFWIELRKGSSPPGFFLLLNGWTWCFGDDVWAMRSLCAAASSLALLGFVRVLRNLGSDAVHREVALGVYASAPFLCWYAQELRPYSLLELGFVVMLLGLTERVERSGLRRALLAGGALLACAVHYFGLVAVGSITVVRLFLSSGLGRSRRLVDAAWVWAGVVPLIPVYVWVLPHQIGNPWGVFADTSWHYVLSLPVRVLWVQPGAMPVWLTSVAPLAFLVCGAGLATSLRDSNRRRILGACGFGFSAPVVALLLASQLIEPRLTPRYLIFAAPLVALAVGVSARGLPPRVAGVALLGLLLGHSGMRVWVGTHEAKDGYREAAESIAASWAPGDRVCPVTAMPGGFGVGALRPYLRDLEGPVPIHLGFEFPSESDQPVEPLPRGARVHLVLRWHRYSSGHARSVLEDERLRILERGPVVRAVQHVIAIVGAD